MKLHPDDPLHAQAEADLLELIRLEDAKSFRLVIMHDNDTGEWRVETSDLDATGTSFGRGKDFASAWHEQTSPALRSSRPKR